jgi:hypothetical protein
MACHPTCTKMVLDYAIDTLDISQKRLSIKIISKAIGANSTGASPARIEDINILLKDSCPPIKFKVVEPATFPTIEQEIEPEKGKPRPVIAWTNVKDDLDGKPWHVVIINGYSDEREEIYYIDPLLEEQYSQKSCEMGTFLKKRLGNSGKLVILIISEEGQTDLLGNVVSLKKKRRSKKQ